jgi:hypothetical protein
MALILRGLNFRRLLFAIAHGIPPCQPSASAQHSKPPEMVLRRVTVTLKQRELHHAASPVAVSSLGTAWKWPSHLPSTQARPQAHNCARDPPRSPTGLPTAQGNGKPSRALRHPTAHDARTKVTHMFRSNLRTISAHRSSTQSLVRSNKPEADQPLDVLRSKKSGHLSRGGWHGNSKGEGPSKKPDYYTSRILWTFVGIYAFTVAQKAAFVNECYYMIPVGFKQRFDRKYTTSWKPLKYMAVMFFWTAISKLPEACQRKYLDGELGGIDPEKDGEEFRPDLFPENPLPVLGKWPVSCRAPVDGAFGKLHAHC